MEGGKEDDDVIALSSSCDGIVSSLHIHEYIHELHF